jgi:hypothetical protein
MVRRTRAFSYLKVIRLDSPSTTIYCQINKDSFDALYNPIVGVNMMSSIFLMIY